MYYSPEIILKQFVLPLLLIFLLLILFLIIVSRLGYKVRQSKIDNVRNLIEDYLATEVFNLSENHNFKESLDGFLKTIPFHKNWCKNIFIKQLIDFKYSVKGSFSDRLLNIYVMVNLHKYSLKLIKSRKWYKKSIGFYHFQAMGFNDGQRYIKPYLNHKHKKLRSNAYIAFLYLSTGPLDFLVDYKQPILEAIEHKIVHILYERKPAMPTNIDQWLDSENPSIVKLGIKFMVFYNYPAASRRIIDLLNSPNETVRFEAILAVKELYLSEAEGELVKKLKSENSKKNALVILEALRVIGSEYSLIFLYDFITSDKIDGDLKLAAVGCLNQINADYLNNSFRNDEDVELIRQHIKSPYLLNS